MCSTTTVFMIQYMIGRGPMYFNAATWLAASWGTGQEEMPMKSLKQEQVRSKDGRAPGDAYIMHPYFAPKRNFVKWFFLGSFVKDGVPDLLAKYTMVRGENFKSLESTFLKSGWFHLRWFERYFFLFWLGPHIQFSKLSTFSRWLCSRTFWKYIQ